MSDKNLTVILHIGMSKTGTTAIQRFLYENMDLLQEKDVIYPSNYRNIETGYDDWGHHNLSHKWGGWLNPDIFPVSPEEAWEELSNKIKEIDKGTVIISSERFQDLLVQENALEILNFIKEKVQPATLKVLGYVRRQDTFAESHYKELVKNAFNRVSVQEYIKNLPAFYDYYQYFKTCAKVVGDENIIVRPFDKNYFVNGDLLNDFAYACGFELPKNAIYSKDLVNPSLDSALASIAAELDIGLLWKDERFRAAMYNFFKEKGRIEEGKKPLIGSVEQNNIMLKYEGSNQLLLEKYLGNEFVNAFEKVSIKENDAFDREKKLYSTKDVVQILAFTANYLKRKIAE